MEKKKKWMKFYGIRILQGSKPQVVHGTTIMDHEVLTAVEAAKKALALHRILQIGNLEKIAKIKLVG